MRQHTGYFVQDERPEPLFGAAAPSFSFLVPPSYIGSEGRCSDGDWPILDQGILESCVSNVIAVQAFHAWKKAGVVRPKLPSRLQNYFNSRARHNAQNQDFGTYPNLSYDSLRDGFCTEEHWPYLPTRVFTPPSVTALRMSYDQSHEALEKNDGTRLNAHDLRTYRIGDDRSERETEIRQSISSDHPVALGLSVDRAFLDKRDASIWSYTGPRLGRHYVLASRYTADAVYCRSSWSERYGDEGGIWVAWSTILDPYLCTDPIVLLSLAYPSDQQAA